MGLDDTMATVPAGGVQALQIPVARIFESPRCSV